MPELPSHDSGGLLQGQRVALIGKLAGMSKREAQQLIREHGGVTQEKLDPDVQLLVVGEHESPLLDLSQLLDDASRQAVERGTLMVITETQLWQRLGFVESEQNIHRLYTPAMLADLLQVPVEVIRRWHRRGLIVPAREVRKLPYFDFQEVATARRLAELLAAGVSPQAVEKKLAALSRLLPGVERPLAQLSVIVQGRELLLRQGDGLIEPGGQLRFDFEAEPESPPTGSEASAADLSTTLPNPSTLAISDRATISPAELRAWAGQLEDAGQLELAADMYRAVLAAGGPQADVCFQLAELLYRLGDVSAARERYYVTIELDEDFVEARNNLGCVLAETGQLDLAVAAFEGALAHHPDYLDAHYHLARVLDEQGNAHDAEQHWRAFLELAPDSPWADAARLRVNGMESGDRNPNDELKPE
jgi:tetratricopeptide (TPR) repeat protein